MKKLSVLFMLIIMLISTTVITAYGTEVQTRTNVNIQEKQSYPIYIGQGGTSGNNGETSTGFNSEANGGVSGKACIKEVLR